MAITASSMAAKVEAKVEAAMEREIREIDRVWLLAVCEGIVEEILDNNVILPDTLNVTVESINYQVEGTGKLT